MKEIYLDHAAATQPSAKVAAAVARTQRVVFANPSSFNEAGRRAAAVLAGARADVARFLHARPDEIVFCASGSEANTLALTGSRAAHPGGVLTADTEHPSVLEAAIRPRDARGAVARLSVDGEGRVRPEEVAARLSDDLAVVSLMYANNEMGTIQPIVRIGRAIAEWRRQRGSEYPLFHVDACQAAGTLPMDVRRLGVDLLTLNGVKVHGPHGAAVLFVRRGVRLEPGVFGGVQEGGRRAGTEDVAAAVGLAVALGDIRPTDAVKTRRLRDRLIAGIMRTVPDVRLNGPSGDERLAGNVNVSFPGCDSERLLLELDRVGVRAGSGSACTAHRVEPSHVLKAIGVPRRYLDGVVRFSLARTTTQREIDTVVRLLPGVVARAKARRSRNA